MNRSTISDNCIIKQDARIVSVNEKMNFSLLMLLHNLIRSYGTYKHQTIYIDADDLSITDKRLLLSHFESSEWYDYLCQSEEKTNEFFNEGKDHYQQILNAECYEVYRDAMEEMRDYK